MSQPTKSITTKSDVFTVQLLDWDTQILGMNVGRITEIASRDGASSIANFDGLEKSLLGLDLEYVTVRRPSSEWTRIHAFEKVGFVTVDGILSFAKKLESSKATSEARLAEEKETDAVAALAVETFRRSRFHNDPVVSKSAADRIHDEWARNCMSGVAAKAVLVVDDGSSIGGFITCKIDGKTGVIDLVGVAPKSAGKGIGKALVQASCDWFAKAGCVDVRVQTQIDNHAAIRLYSSTGFAPNSTSITLRWTTRPAVAR